MSSAHSRDRHRADSFHRSPGLVHSKCSGRQNAAEYRRFKNWACTLPLPIPSPIATNAPGGNPFTILQFNANVVELSEYLERHNAKVAVILKFSDASQTSPQ